MTRCQKDLWKGHCCCNCKYHIEDFYHCTTVTRDEKLRLSDDNCVCNIHKGWICMPQHLEGIGRAHSGWEEHGMCEMHELKENICGAILK